MATGTQSKTKGAGKRKTTQRASATDAIKLLEADHREVEKLFSAYENASGKATKAKLSEQICLALKVHT